MAMKREILAVASASREAFWQLAWRRRLRSRRPAAGGCVAGGLAASSLAGVLISSSSGASCAEEASTAEEGGACAACTQAAARVFCGGEHTLLRDPATLEVYQLGACGLGFDHDNVGMAADPGAYSRKVTLPGPASSIMAGYYHNLFRLVGGRCFSYGCGRQAPNDGQLVNGSLAEDTQPVSTQLKFADAALGGHHSVCRLRNGQVWAAGAGWQGQMGNGGLQYKNSDPVHVSALPRVKSLAGGYYHNAALTEAGEWYVWGCNESGQLGKLDEDQIKVPRPLAEIVPWLGTVQVQAFDGGYGHSLLMLKDGRVFTMGNPSEGQRGLDPDVEDDPPLLNQVTGFPAPAEAIAAGNHHSMVLIGGRVYAFGSDEFGQVSGCAPVGEDVDHRRWQPQMVAGLPDGDPVTRISAGICHSAAQTASGRIFLWGCGGNGQTGDGTLPESSPVSEIDIALVARRCASTAP